MIIEYKNENKIQRIVTNNFSIQSLLNCFEPRDSVSIIFDNYEEVKEQCERFRFFPPVGLKIEAKRYYGKYKMDISHKNVELDNNNYDLENII